MKIYDIDNINKVDGVYDLTQLTSRYNIDQGFKEYVVQRGEEMRIKSKPNPSAILKATSVLYTPSS